MKIDIQELYDEVEEEAFQLGVPSVAQWIRDTLNEKYEIQLSYDPELDDLE
jgi:hypothetical protein